MLYSIEECTDKNFTLRVGAQIGVNALPYANRLLQAEMQKGTHAISRLLNPHQEPVGQGIVVFENALGGRIAVAPRDAAVAPAHFTQRHAQFVRLLAWLGCGKSTGCVAGGAWLMPQFFIADGQWRAIVWNGCPDAIREMEITAPGGKGKAFSAMHLDAEGGLHPAVIKGRHLLFRCPVMQWECMVVND